MVDSVLRGQAYRDSLRGRHAVVVGLAKSGIAAARLLHECGAAVVAADAKSLAALGRDARELVGLGIRVIAEPEALNAVRGADLVVVSPGVPFDAVVPSAARAAGVPVIGELELGWRAVGAETI